MSARPVAARTFAALANGNYRRYFAGQAISQVGTWMQTVGQGWLVLTLTGSGTTLGLVVALQFLPVLLLGPYGGVVVDRIGKRRLLIATQSTMATLALVLGALTVAHAVRLWEVIVLALCLGLVNTLDNPARQSFVLEMVGPAHLRNAVSLNSVLVNAARAVGPAVAGVLIVTVGVGVCFLVNAASYLAVIASLASLNLAHLRPSAPVARAKGQLREGLAYVRRTPAIAVPLVMMALIGTLAYEFQVVLPVVARNTFHGGAGAYGLMTAAMGAGAVVGGLIVAGYARTGLRPLVVAAAGFGLVILGAALAPSLAVEVVMLALVGAGSVAFLAVGNSTLQLAAAPQMRGRIMSLWAVAFLGSTPIGGPIAGLVAEHAGPRWGLVLGGVAALAAASVGALVLARGGWRRPRRASASACPACELAPLPPCVKPPTGRRGGRWRPWAARPHRITQRRPPPDGRNALTSAPISLRRRPRAEAGARAAPPVSGSAASVGAAPVPPAGSPPGSVPHPTIR